MVITMALSSLIVLKNEHRRTACMDTIAKWVEYDHPGISISWKHISSMDVIAARSR